MDISRHGEEATKTKITKIIEPEMIELEKTSTKSKTKSKTKSQEKTPTSMSSVFSKSLAIIKEKTSVINIRPSTLHLILKYVMEEVETTPIKGSEQKDFALKLIRELIIDLTDKDDEEILLKLVDDGTISNMIDFIIDATHGKLNINTTLAATSGCLNTCIPYLFRS